MDVGVLTRCCVTEHRGRMVRKNSFCTCRGYGDWLPVREVIRGFCQPLADVGVVPCVKLSRIPYAAFPLNYGQIIFFYRCTVHSDIHTVNLPTDAYLLEHSLNLH